MDRKEADSIGRTKWTSHRSPVCLTQPWELTSHQHPGSHRLSYCPLCPLLNQSQRVGLNSYWGLWRNRSSSHRQTQWCCCTGFGLITLLRKWPQLHKHPHSTPTPSLPLPHKECTLDWDPDLYGHAYNALTHVSEIKLWGLFFWRLCQERDFPPHLHGGVVQLFHQQSDHIRALYCREAQEEYATCHSLIYVP